MWWREKVKDFSDYVRFQNEEYRGRRQREEAVERVWSFVTLCLEHFNHHSRGAVMKKQSSTEQGPSTGCIDETLMALATMFLSRTLHICRGKESINRTLPQTSPLRLSMMNWSSCERLVSEAPPCKTSSWRGSSSISETPRPQRPEPLLHVAQLGLLELHLWMSG